MWHSTGSHLCSTKSLTTDDFYFLWKTPETRPRPRFFEHNNYFDHRRPQRSSTMVLHYLKWEHLRPRHLSRHLPMRYWNGTACLLLCARPPRARNGSRTEVELTIDHEKHKKHDATCFLHNSPPNPLIPNAPPPLRTVATPDLPQSSIKMTSPQQETGCDSRSLAFIPPPPAFPWPAASTTTINNQQLKMQQPPATQQSTTIRLEGREGRRAKSRQEPAGCRRQIQGQLFVIFPNKCIATINQIYPPCLGQNMGKQKKWNNEIKLQSIQQPCI